MEDITLEENLETAATTETTEESAIQINLKPPVLGEVAGLPITNSIIVAVLITVVTTVFFAMIAKRMKAVPGKAQLFVESFLIYCNDFVDSIYGKGSTAKKMFPFFTTMFIFFLASNLVGFIPGMAAVSFNDSPLFRAPTSSYATIFVITMAMFIALQLTVLVTAGLRGYLKQFINFDSVIDLIMGPLNIVGEIAKVVSLSFRLFGNIFAGQVIATVVLAIIPLVIMDIPFIVNGPLTALLQLPFSLLGLLSSIIQALVFPLLVLIYFKMGLDVRKEYEAGLAAKADKKALKQNSGTSSPAAELA